MFPKGPMFASQPGHRRARGFTLLEILVVSAIAALLAVTAATLLVTMSSQRAANRKRLDRLTQSFTAMTVLERTLLNAGYHFPSSRFAFRVYDNVTSGTLAGIPVCPAAGMTGDCIVRNTDVLELVEGIAPQPGQISGQDVDGGASGGWVRLFSPGGPLQLDAGVYPANKYLMLFGKPGGFNCAAIGGLPGSDPLEHTVIMVDRDLGLQNNNYYAPSPTTAAPRNYKCPDGMDPVSGTFMTMSVAGSRHVYFVVTDGGGVGLAMKEIGPTSTAKAGADGGGFTLLSNGVDNFQVVPLVVRGDAGFATGCTGTGMAAVCECNTPGSSCALDNTPADTDTQFYASGQVIGVRIGLSVLGETNERLRSDNPSFTQVPNRLGNETMPADNLKRTTQTQTYMLRNFKQVEP